MSTTITTTARPVRVLIHAAAISSGGVHRLVHRLLGTWLDTTDPAEWQFRVVSQPVDTDGHPIDWPGALFTPLCGDEIRGRSGAALCDWLHDNQDRFFALLRRQAATADVVWLPQPWWTLRLVREQVDLPAHLVPTLHDFAFDTLGWHGWFGDCFRAEARALLAASSQVIFSSRHTLEHARAHYGLAPDRGTVVHLADFLPPTFHPTTAEAARVRTAHGLPPRYWLALHAAGHKGLETIVAAHARLCDDGRRPWPLVIGGKGTEQLRGHDPGDGPLVEIARRLRAHGLVHGVDYHALGFVPDADLGGLYRGAAGAIAASRSEAGFSGTVFEALHARTPLVHSDIAPFVERLGEDGRHALRFRTGDAADLARAMAAVERDPAAAAARAAVAHDSFAGRGWPDVAADYLGVFAAAAARGPATRRTRPRTLPRPVPPGPPGRFHRLLGRLGRLVGRRRRVGS
jgi:glycosyltransferase involved in cell wall biosynthesis